MEMSALKLSFDNRGDISPEQWAADEMTRLFLGRNYPDSVAIDNREHKEVLLDVVSKLELNDDDWGVLLLFFMMNLASLFAQADGIMGSG